MSKKFTKFLLGEKTLFFSGIGLCVKKIPEFYADFITEGIYLKKSTEKKITTKAVFRKKSAQVPRRNVFLGLSFFGTFSE